MIQLLARMVSETATSLKTDEPVCLFLFVAGFAACFGLGYAVWLVFHWGN